MFCPNCGAQLADGTPVCPNCKATLNSAPAPQYAQPQAPQYAQPAPQYTAPAGSVKPISRMKFFWSAAAPKEKKTLNIVALVLGIVSLLMIILGANKTVNGSIFKIPIINLVGSAVTDDFDEAQDMLDEAIEEAEDNMDDIEEILEDTLDVYISDIEDELDMDIDDFLKLFKPLSLNHLVKLSEILDVDDSEVVIALKTVINVVTSFAVVFAILTALGIFFQKTWIMILSCVLSSIFVWITGGIVFMLIAVTTFVLTCVFMSKLNGTYKAYRASLGVR